MPSNKLKYVCSGFALAVLFALAGCNNDNESAPVEAAPVPAPSTAPRPPEAAAGGNLARIQAAKILRIGVKADNPPFGFQDAEGRPQGFDVDLGFRIARALQVQPVFVTVTSKDRI